MRERSIFTAVCDKCGREIASESREVVCCCGQRIVMEWPCATEMPAEVR